MQSGQVIARNEDGSLIVPDHPFISLIAGDGVGPDLSAVAVPVLDAAIRAAYGEDRGVVWLPLAADDAGTPALIREHGVGLKGPLAPATDAALHRALGLEASVRALRWLPGAPSALARPEAVDVLLVRSAQADATFGCAPADPAVAALLEALAGQGQAAPAEGLVDVRVVDKAATQAMIRRALQLALDAGRVRVTLVSGAGDHLRDWGYEVAQRDFGRVAVAESDFYADLGGVLPADKRLVVGARSVDAVLPGLLATPADFGVLVAQGEAGASLEATCAALLGGPWLLAGAAYGEGVALFEATHDPDPGAAGEDAANPTSLILSGALLLRHLGWTEAAEKVEGGLAAAIAQKTVTADLHGQLTGATLRSCSAFGRDIIENM